MNTVYPFIILLIIKEKNLKLPLLVLKIAIVPFGRRWLCWRWLRGWLTGRLYAAGMRACVPGAWDPWDGEECSVSLSQEPPLLPVGNEYKLFGYNINPNHPNTNFKWDLRRINIREFAILLEGKVAEVRILFPDLCLLAVFLFLRQYVKFEQSNSFETFNLLGKSNPVWTSQVNNKLSLPHNEFSFEPE